VRGSPLPQLLGDTCPDAAGFFPNDKVAALRFIQADGRKLYLLHQLFGAKGNTTLLDQKATLLWSRHRPPHSLLAVVPPAAVWQGTPDARAEAEVSAAALAHLTDRLALDLDRSLRGTLDRHLKSADRLVENLTRDLDNAEQGDLHRRRAEALAANLHTLRQGLDRVDLADLRDGSPLTIALDPALTPAANMEAWFRRARKADKGRDIIRERLAEARHRRDNLAADVASLDDASGRLSNLLDWRDAHPELTTTRNGTRAGRAVEAPARPFRRYLIDGVWEVWVGRNNKENDQLTHRASHLRDIWLHAQGVAGSHVILRTAGKPETVPKVVLHKAAALAALHSKARHSSLVPVIHTERRYVRKPRKAAAGLAVCLQEKNVFVEPGVAAGVALT